MARSLLLAVMLPRVVDDPRISRRIRVSGERTVHFVKLLGVEDVDDQIRNWLTEAYAAAGG